MKAALYALPTTLDETYERMLTRIKGRHMRAEALVLLRWIAFAKCPLTLKELVDTVINDWEGDGGVDFGDRGGVDDTLNILSGLITTVLVDDALESQEVQPWTTNISHIEPENAPEDMNAGFTMLGLSWAFEGNPTHHSPTLRQQVSSATRVKARALLCERIPRISTHPGDCFEGLPVTSW